MERPSLADYITLIYKLFDEFVQAFEEYETTDKWKTYSDKGLIVFLLFMQFRGITTFQAQARWLKTHPQDWHYFGFESAPDRTTLSRRYKALSDILTKLIAYNGVNAADLEPSFSNKNLAHDKSLFKAVGPVWHQSDRKQGRIPEKLRNLDTDATWSKSGYQGWVYGYGLHVLCSQAGFPKYCHIETANVSDSAVLDQLAPKIWEMFEPKSVTTDDGYTQAMRIRRWVKAGTLLVTPALRWKTGKYASNYHRFLQESDAQKWLNQRKTSVEPLFDLIAKVMNISGYQKPLKQRFLANVTTSLLIGTLSVQISMIINSIFGNPLREIAHMKAVFS